MLNGKIFVHLKVCPEKLKVDVITSQNTLKICNKKQVDKVYDAFLLV